MHNPLLLISTVYSLRVQFVYRLATAWLVRDRIRRGRDLPCFQTCPSSTQPSQRFPVLSAKAQWPERDAPRPHPTRAGLRMGRNYASISPLCLHRLVMGWPLPLLSTSSQTKCRRAILRWYELFLLQSASQHKTVAGGFIRLSVEKEPQLATRSTYMDPYTHYAQNPELCESVTDKFALKAPNRTVQTFTAVQPRWHGRRSRSFRAVAPIRQRRLR